MKIKITGATGFIGSHLSKYLLNLDYEVYVIPRNDFETKYIGGIGDVLVHCAWPRESDLNSLEHIDFARKTIELFTYCKSIGLRVINIGSSSEYGTKYEPMREEMSCEPITLYGISKLAVTLHAKNLGFNTLRLFTVTGDGGKSFFDIKNRTNKWAYPMDVRDTVDVSLVCKAIERLIHAPHLYGEIINVGSGTGTRYEDVAETNDSDKWMKYPQRQFEPKYWEADTSKMRRILNL